ncbi:MAG TPA: hypothetical protein VK066_28200 [Chloroflexota bacterium]|nr:hypothetical protein [Chloroflexota bacterium]
MREQRTMDIPLLIASVAPALRRLRAALPVPLSGETSDPGASERAELLRRALQEWGVECRLEEGLAALEAFGIVSGRGVEIAVAADLSPADLALAYARSLVRLGLVEDRSFATWFHYRSGCAPAHETADERRTMAVIDATARALMAGRLDATPRYLLRASTGEGLGAAGGLWGECSRALLGRLHRASSALYWRSDSYQALRASAPMVVLTSRVHALLSATAA